MAFKTDIEIAREASKQPILAVGAKLGIPSEHLLPYGHDKAKIGQDFIKSLADRPDGKLILVTAINPTPAGEGKTDRKSTRLNSSHAIPSRMPSSA